MDQQAGQLRFLQALAPGESGTTALVGVPYDGAVSYRAGAGGAPRAIREASDSIESYCPILDRDLRDHPPVDLGDLDVDPRCDGDAAVLQIRSQLGRLRDVPMLVLGGDHLVALPFIERALERHPDVQILHIDAHLDLRDGWDGSGHSHATVMRRVLERMGKDAALWSWGIRSGTREEFALAREHPRIHLVEDDDGPGVAERLRDGGRPVYVTLDADGIDPSELPGTGNPEPAGLSFANVERALTTVAGRVVGADLVEIAPSLDPTGLSAVVGARLARTLLLALAARPLSRSTR